MAVAASCTLAPQPQRLRRGRRGARAVRAAPACAAWRSGAAGESPLSHAAPAALREAALGFAAAALLLTSAPYAHALDLASPDAGVVRPSACYTPGCCAVIARLGLRPRPRGSEPRLRAARWHWLSRSPSRQVMQAQMQDAAEEAAEAASQAAGEALSQIGTAAADGAASAAVGLGQAVVDASVAAAPVVLDGLKAAVPVV